MLALSTIRTSVVLVFAGAGLSACAGLDTRLPEISAPDLAAETARQEQVALQRIDENAKRLMDIGWPVLAANAQLCPRVRPALGIKTHTLKSYPKRLRAAAERVMGADDTPRIFQIAAGSPAEKAGLQTGDVILDDAGEPARIEDDWDDVLADQIVNIRRSGERMSVEVEAETICDYNLRLSPGGEINAYADGRNITITSAMVEFVESDDELALIVGHELAHNTMGHIRKIVGNFIVSLGGTRYTRPFESEADYVGLYYLVRAGYEPDGVEAFWQRLARISPKGISRAKTHPTFPDRFLRIAAARREIAAKQAAGEKLVPNFLTSDVETAAPSDS